RVNEPHGGDTRGSQDGHSLGVLNHRLSLRRINLSERSEIVNSQERRHNEPPPTSGSPDPDEPATTPPSPHPPPQTTASATCHQDAHSQSATVDTGQGGEPGGLP